MGRQSLKFLRFAEQLDKQVEILTDLFFEERPFLTGGDLEFRSLTDEQIEQKVDCLHAIDLLILKVKEVAYDTGRSAPVVRGVQT